MEVLLSVNSSSHVHTKQWGGGKTLLCFQFDLA